MSWSASLHGISHQELLLKQHTGGKGCFTGHGDAFSPGLGVIFSPDTCLSPEMPSARGNVLKLNLPSTFGHLSFLCLLLCPQLSLPPRLLGFPLLEALCWCPHNLFSLLNGFWYLIYITQHHHKWSRVGGIAQIDYSS